MYPSAMPGDTQKRTLAPDDQAGVCGIYPIDGQPPDGGRGRRRALAPWAKAARRRAAGALAAVLVGGGAAPAEAHLMRRAVGVRAAGLRRCWRQRASRAYVRARAAQSPLPTFWDAGLPGRHRST